VEIKDEVMNSNFTIEVSALRTQSPVSLCAHNILMIYRFSLIQLTQRAAKSFTLLIKPCPPGYVLNATGNSDEHDCKCDDRDQNIQSCLSRKKLVLQVARRCMLCVSRCFIYVYVI